jgi:serpin B
MRFEPHSTRWLLVASLAGGLASGCTHSPGEPTSEARSNLTRDLAPNVPSYAQAALEAGNAQFAFEALAAAAPTGANIAVSPYSLSSALAMLYAGARAAFSLSAADFTGISARGQIYLKDAFHQVFVAVDEEGTEAAAATAVTLATHSATIPDVTMKVDHPFFFAVRDLPTNTLLFVGWVANP